MAASAGDTRNAGSIPGWKRSPGGGHGNPLQYSSLENLMNRGAWRAKVHGVAKSRTRLSMCTRHTHTHTHTHRRRPMGIVLAAQALASQCHPSYSLSDLKVEACSTSGVPKLSCAFESYGRLTNMPRAKSLRWSFQVSKSELENLHLNQVPK